VESIAAAWAWIAACCAAIRLDKALVRFQGCGWLALRYDACEKANGDCYGLIFDNVALA
jgi:hypothetical protein